MQLHNKKLLKSVQKKEPNSKIETEKKRTQQQQQTDTKHTNSTPNQLNMST